MVHRPIKHYVQTGLGTNFAGGATILELPLVVGTSAGDGYSAIGYNVNAGSAIVPFIDITIEAFINNKTTASTVAFDRIAFYIGFNIANQQTMPDPSLLNQSDVKNQIFHTQFTYLACSTAIINNGGVNGNKAIWHIPLKIPKQYQSINRDDHISIFVTCADTAATHNFQIQATYKEFFQV